MSRLGYGIFFGLGYNQRMSKISRPPPDFALSENGWQAVWPFPKPSNPNSFVSGARSDSRIRVNYYRRLVDGLLVGKVWFGPKCEGPPGCAHGGSIAAVLDEVMGAAVWMAGHPVVSARISIDFRKTIPLHSVVRLEANVLSVSGKKIVAHGKLTDEQGHVFAQGEGLFISVGVKGFVQNEGSSSP